MKQEMIGWQWHQMDHMQMICTSLQTDNHAITSSLNFLQAGCSSWCLTNNVKALKAIFCEYTKLESITLVENSWQKPCNRLLKVIVVEDSLVQFYIMVIAAVQFCSAIQFSVVMLGLARCKKISRKTYMAFTRMGTELERWRWWCDIVS